jgi:endonuclease/exonuclease/phosphatase family metal-dependent hydrolase
MSFCLGLAAMLAAACGPEVCEETEHVPGARAALSALTYNAGLGPGMVRYSAERTPEVKAAVAGEPFDLLCLQEIWLQKDSDAFAAMFESAGFHVLRADTRGLNETGKETCEPGDLDGVIACAERECAGWTDAELSFCARNRCKDELEDLLFANIDCAVCAVATVGKPLAEVERVCTTTGASRIHDGGNGVLLVSRFPLENAEVLHLPASFANRVALMARVRLPTGPVEAACTHISATQPLPPLQSEWDWWTEEKEVQIGMVCDRLKERGGCAPQLFMGDMNTSIANGELVASTPSAYAVAEEKGFDSPAATWSPPVCSSCADNTFHDPEGTSRLIDHVMVRTGKATAFDAVAVERTIDWTVTITDMGRTVETSLSDHYGIRVAFDVSTE